MRDQEAHEGVAPRLLPLARPPAPRRCACRARPTSRAPAPVIGTRSSSSPGSSPRVLAAVHRVGPLVVLRRGRAGPRRRPRRACRSTMSRSASEARIGANSGDRGSWANSRHSSGPVTAFMVGTPVVDVAQMQAYCLAKPGAWPDNPWEPRAPGDQGRAGGAGQDLRLPRRRRRGRQERAHPRGGRRVAAAVPGRRDRDGLHRPVGLEQPGLRRAPSPTRTWSTPSTSPTGWSSRGCRRSCDPTAGTRPEPSRFAWRATVSPTSRATTRATYSTPATCSIITSDRA